MMHPVKRLPTATRLLDDVVVLQVTLLQIVSELPAEPLPSSDKFIAAHASRLVALGWTPEAAETAIDWVATIRNRQLWSALGRFARAAQDKKRDIVERICEDLLLLECPSSERFRFSVQRTAKRHEKAVKAFLYPFYDIWRTGFPQAFFTSTLDETAVGSTRAKTNYKRQDFLREFLRINDHFVTCPMCDSALYRALTPARIYSSVDHYFPRSIFPHLSCHPLNLIPVCSTCNEAMKGTTNPFGTRSSSFTLQDFSLPYRQNDRSFGSRTYGEVTLRPVSIAATKPKPHYPVALELPSIVEVKLRPGNGEAALTEAIRAWSHLYKVEKQWNADIDLIGDRVFRRIEQFLSAVPLSDTTNAGVLSERLNLLLALIHEHDIGQDPHAFLLVWLIHHYLQELEDGGDEAAIFQSLRGWLQEYSEIAMGYLDVAREVRRRALP